MHLSFTKAVKARTHLNTELIHSHKNFQIIQAPLVPLSINPSTHYINAPELSAYEKPH